MKKLLTTSFLLIATGCTTLGSTQTTPAKDSSPKEESIREVRQHALLEALGSKAQ